MSAPRACILGVAGPVLGRDEAAFLREADPWGFILFARNVEEPGQLRRLTGALRAAVGREAPVLIDQEGGRVARLRPPHWRDWPPPAEACAAAGDEATLLAMLARRYRLIGEELRGCGIDVNCVPALDMARHETHPVLANRLLGGEPEAITRRGRAVIAGCLAGGVLPVVKHMPGQGRARIDSHEGLPVVDTPLATLRERDFAPFRALGDAPLGMTAHVVYAALDPERCATLSPAAIGEIRSGLGFRGCLMSDDISMGALSGPIGARCRDALAAGCDLVLHCSGERAEMEEVAGAAPRLSGTAALRATAALADRSRGPEARAHA